MVVPVGPVFNSYAEEVSKKLHDAGFCCDVDTDDGNTMNKKVRNAQLAQYNFIFGKFQVETAGWAFSKSFVKITLFDNFSCGRKGKV